MKSVIMPFAIADTSPRAEDLALLEFCDGRTPRTQVASRLGMSEQALEAALDRLHREGITAPAEM
ncbi:MAG: winged helix-turn-helix domain-containing protein, partial [Candidatus Eremiobacteraeota bacterium]|nr:winged helix-turn-helix domain-containing protein [Candidatus Eremiobacteraeota bacterium]